MSENLQRTGDLLLAKEIAALDHYRDELTCPRCGEELGLRDDDLCAECRMEIDEVYADLPGAEQ